MSLKFRRIQFIRRLVQWLVIALILLGPLLAKYTNYLLAHELDDMLGDWRGSVQGTLLAATDKGLQALPGGREDRDGQPARDRDAVLGYARLVSGNIWSMRLGPVSLTDPLAALESIAASKGAATALWLSLLIPVGIALLLGRVFCTWACPMGLLLEYTDRLRNVLKFLELPPRDFHPSRLTKYTLLATGLLLSAILSLPVLGYIYPPAILGRELHDLMDGLFQHAELGSPGWWAGGLTWMSLLILAIALFEVTISRRWWCRYICPGGAVYSLLGRFRPVRVRRNADRCTSCGDCVRVCPMALAPMMDRMGLECDNCGICVSHCNDHALGYTLHAAKRTGVAKGGADAAA